MITPCITSNLLIHFIEWLVCDVFDFIVESVGGNKKGGLLIYYLDELYDSVLKTKIDIMDCLLNSTEGRTTIELSQHLDLSSTTVTKYIKEINSDLMYPGHEVSIRTSENNMLFLEYSDILYYKQFKRNLIFENWSIKLFLRLLLGYKVNRIKFVQDNFISEATYRRSIATITKQISAYKLIIKSNKGFNYLIGDEKNTRLYANKVFWQLFHGEVWPFDEIDEDLISDIVKSKKNESYIKNVNNINIKQTMYSLSIQIIRYRNGYEVDIPYYLRDEAEYISEKFHLDKLKSTLSKKEIEFFFLRLFSYPRFMNTELGRHFIKNAKLNNTFLSRISSEFSYYLSTNYLNLSLDDQKNIESSVYSAHVNALLYPTWRDTENNHYFEEFPMLKKNMNIIAFHLSEKFGLYNIVSNNYILNQYMLIFSQLKDLSYFEPTVDILLDTEFGIFTENIIKKTLDGRLRAYLNISIHTSLADFVDSIADLKIVVTTSKTPELTRQFKAENILYINEVPTDEDYHTIYTSIKHLITKLSS